MMTDEILTIVNVEYIKDYILHISFNNGQSRYFDFATVYDSGILKKLKDISYFKSFRLDPFTIDWNNEIGFDPEFLLEGGGIQF